MKLLKESKENRCVMKIACWEQRMRQATQIGGFLQEQFPDLPWKPANLVSACVITAL